MLDPERWKRIDHLLQSALRLPVDQRAAFVSQSCEGDGTLEREVEALLTAHHEAGNFLERPALDVAAQVLALREAVDVQESAASPAGATIGPYHLIQMLGAGGMGEVWRAEQTQPFRRTVALKLIKAGMDTNAVVARFESERQALAMMDHPNIAKIFDAGETPAGRPYFAMEYVPGLSITDYCDQHRLTIKERLLLFIQVCEGVQHAHQQTIIHRDLKPSNVLVQEVEGKPIPKIIDFGLAKATAQRLTEMTMLTEVGVMVGTPSYMSPEQADSNERNIDTRTDVYSLGVILYELLVGALPFGSPELREVGLEAMLHKIREEEPPRPSTKLVSLGNASSDSALKRGEETQSLVRHLRGELDWITLKTLEKDRSQRYGSPSELAADIQRHLQNQPVLAGPPSARYRAAKFVRRHRFGVAVAAAAMLLLVGFAAAMAAQARRTARERDRANRESLASKRVAEFMTNMFKVSDPSEARGNTITAREILDKSSKEIENGLAQDPELKAQMLHVIGSVYQGLGLFSRAEPQLRQAAEIRRRLFGPQHPDTLASSERLAHVIQSEGRYGEAVKMLSELVPLEQRVFGPDHRTTLSSQSNLAWAVEDEGHLPEAEKLCKETLDRQQRILGPDDPDTLESMRRLSWILGTEGRYAEAEKFGRETFDRRKRVLGQESPKTLLTMSELGVLLVEEGRNSEAEELLRETLGLQRRVLGPEHEATRSTAEALAAAFQHDHRFADAEQLYEDSFAGLRRTLGPDHPETLMAKSNLAELLVDEGHYPEAEKMQREVLAVRRRVMGPDHPDTALSLFDIGDVLYHEHRYPETAAAFRETVDVRRRVLGLQHPDTLESMARLACVLALMHRKDEAISTLREAFAGGLDLQKLTEIDKNRDLKSLRGDPRFAALITLAKEGANTMPTRQ